MTMLLTSMLYNSSKRQRSLCAQLRSDILPLNVESGQFVSLEEEKRTCPLVLCDGGNEFHFQFSVILFIGNYTEFCLVREKEKLIL